MHMTLIESVEYLSPEDKSIINAMLKRTALSHDAELGKAIDALQPVVANGEEGIALLRLYNINNGKSKFSTKLSFTQRCEILALHHSGCSRAALSKMYNVDRRTITHIYNPNSPHYVNVREEELRLGRDRFIAHYVTEDVRKAAMLQFPQAEANNKNANRKQGVHSMQNDFCNNPHRVVIQWMEADGHNITTSGWHYRDLDSEWPDSWFNCGATSLRTSQDCFAAALKDISDKIEK